MIEATLLYIISQDKTAVVEKILNEKKEKHKKIKAKPIKFDRKWFTNNFYNIIEHRGLEEMREYEPKSAYSRFLVRGKNKPYYNITYYSIVADVYLQSLIPVDEVIMDF